MIFFPLSSRGMNKEPCARRKWQRMPLPWCMYLIPYIFLPKTLSLYWLVFSIAGAETTATFLAATTYYLLRNPACLARVQEEVRGRFSSYDEINATAAKQLTYLQAVISEGLRMYAPGSQGFPRVSPGMNVGDVYVPAGVRMFFLSLCCKRHWLHVQAEVFTHAWTLTHSEQNFTNSNKFKPERWMDPNSTDIKAASQPFDMGPRGCLGQK